MPNSFYQKFVITSILSISISSMSFAGVVFEMHRDNAGQPLNYKRMGCLISDVYENFTASAIGVLPQSYGTVLATGDKNACKTLCANYNDSFGLNEFRSVVKWQYKDFYDWGNGNYTCQTTYNPFGTRQCFPSNSLSCDLKTIDYPLPPPPTCSMSLNRYIGDPSTIFKMTSFSASSAVSCEVVHNGVVTPIRCSDQGESYSLGKNSVGNKSVTFRALGFGSDADCKQNYTVYNKATCAFLTSTDGGVTFSNATAKLDLSANTRFNFKWSTAGDAYRCDSFKDGKLLHEGIACSAGGTFSTKDYFTTTGSHRIELVVRAKSGNDYLCKQYFDVVP